MNCRFCKNELSHVFVDLGNSPPSNSFLKLAQLNEEESFYPLKVYVCDKCFLVQLDEFKKSESIFSDEYVYFSSYSSSWLKHASDYTDMMVDRFKFNDKSLIVEIASNDGYLLQYFKNKNIPVLGIEPTANTAKVAQEKGIESRTEFFGKKLASNLSQEGKLADLIIGNNVLAHVPDILDFVSGFKLILKKEGVITLEFPHLLQLMQYNQFDTIYHEHFSYLSLSTVKQIFESQDLEIFDVEEIPTHGGSLRVFGKHKSDTSKQIFPSVKQLLEKEITFGLQKIDSYSNYQARALNIKCEFLNFLIEQKIANKTVAAYGAAAKGNTLLNYCGVKSDFIEYVIDANPNKAGKYLPGSHIPVVNENVLKEKKPDYIIILPWNLEYEISEQLNYVKDWGCQFVVLIPGIKIF